MNSAIQLVRCNESKDPLNNSLELNKMMLNPLRVQMDSNNLMSPKGSSILFTPIENN